MENKRTLKNDPQYFGAYLNMARHNIFVINNHLVDRFNDYLADKNKLALLTSEEHIKDCFLTRPVKDRKNHVFSHLVRFLPIAKVIDPELLPKDERVEEKTKKGKDFKALTENFKLCFKELHEFRNEYSHFYSTLYSSVNEIKRKRSINTSLINFLETNRSRAIKYSVKRFTGVFQDKDFELARRIELVKGNEITDYGMVFFVCLFLERDSAFQFINKIVGFKDTRTPEFRATREVFSAFCVNLPHDRFISDDPKQAFILDMFNELNRCPSELFDSLNEEGKRKFQPTLNSVQKSNIEANNLLAQDLLDEDFDEYFQSLTKRIRHQDRFPYFALKFLDTNKSFEKIRFQIDLGKFQIGEYKKMFNNIEEDRVIIENAKAFGRLDEFSSGDKTKNESEKDIEKKINRAQYPNVGFEQFAPRYNYDPEQNKIGFRFFPKGIYNPIYPELKEGNNKTNKVKMNLIQHVPDAFLSINELPKVVLTELLEKGKAEKIIGEFIETNKTKIINKDFIENIKGKLKFDNKFYKRFQGKNEIAYKIEDSQVLANRNKALDGLLEPFNLNHSQIPTRIVEYWLDIKEIQNESQISNRIKDMKKECTKRLKDKRKGKAPKIGEMATFLAKDVVNMIIDKDVKAKITSFYYDKMQECLALFADPEKKGIFISLCNELNLFDKIKGHPFLVGINLNTINYTPDFYEKYLIEKGDKIIVEKEMKMDYKTKKMVKKDVKKDISWLYRNFYTTVWDEESRKNKTKIRMPENLSRMPFSIQKLAEPKSDISQWLNNVNKGKTGEDRPKPIDLPTDLFDSFLVEKLKSQGSLNDSGKNNFSFLLSSFLSGDRQPFYLYGRHYEIYNEPIDFKPNTKPAFKDYFKDRIPSVLLRLNDERIKERKPKLEFKDILRVFNDSITTNEKVIRYYQTKDRIILLMIKELLTQDNDQAQLTLNGIDTSLNETIVIQQKVKGVLSFNLNGELLDRKVEGKQEISKVITDRRKRKDYTILKRFVSDRRLPELFQYFDEAEIPFQSLRDELEEYNKIKELIFDRIFELEKAIIQIDENRIKELFRGRKKEGNIQHEPYLVWLKDKGILNDGDFEFLKVIRNTFSHNLFPPKVIMDKKIQWNISALRSTQIFEKYSALIAAIVDRRMMKPDVEL